MGIAAQRAIFRAVIVRAVIVAIVAANVAEVFQQRTMQRSIPQRLMKPKNRAGVRVQQRDRSIRTPGRLINSQSHVNQPSIKKKQIYRATEIAHQIRRPLAHTGLRVIIVRQNGLPRFRRGGPVQPLDQGRPQFPARPSRERPEKLQKLTKPALSIQ